MKKEIEALSLRIKMLEQATMDGAAKQTAVMLLLQAVVQNSPNRDEIAAQAHRMVALLSVQPDMLRPGNKGTVERTRAAMLQMTGQAPPPA